MTYQHRTTTVVRQVATDLLSGTWKNTAIATSSEEPPHRAIITAIVDAADTDARMVVQGKLPGSSTAAWVYLKDMTSDVEGTAVPGTQGVIAGTQVTFTADVAAYPRMRCRFVGSLANLSVCWITS